MLAISSQFIVGVIVGFIAGAVVVAIGALLVVRRAYNDAESGQVYKPSSKVIVEEYEKQFYNEN